MNDQATDTGQAVPFRKPVDNRVIELDFDQFENREDIVLDPRKPKQAAEALVSTQFTNSEGIRTVNPGAKRVSFPERYWSVGLRLGARGHLIADAQQCAKSGDQSRIAFIVV